MLNLWALVEKAPDADFLREVIGFAAERLIELEVGAATGAGCGEKSRSHLAQRNGSCDRDWETRAGMVGLRIPQLRTGLRLFNAAATIHPKPKFTRQTRYRSSRNRPRQKVTAHHLSLPRHRQSSHRN